MLNKLVLHIGANKTGSSAIQRFLALNRGKLRAEGIIVPNEQCQLNDKVAGHQVFAFQELMAEPVAGRKRLEDSIESIKLAAPEATTILFSAENLTANPIAPSLFPGLKDQYETKVIIYIRRQDEYLLSSWQQWNSKIAGDFWAWLLSVVGGMGNWRTYLENWETVIPRDQINVRIYDRSRLEGGDVITDFYQQLELAIPLQELAYPKQVINPSFSDAIMEIVKGNKSVFRDIHDNHFYQFVRNVTGQKYIRNPRDSSITFAQRQAILHRYAAANRWVKERYFPDLTEELFSAPKESDYDYMSPAALEEQKLEALTSMLLELYQRQRANNGPQLI